MLPLRNGKGALAVQKIPGIKISEELIKKAEGEPEVDLREFSMNLCLEIAKKNADYVCGYHVIGGAYPSLGLALLRELNNLDL